MNQTANELGLKTITSIVGTSDIQTLQLLALLNSAGNELAFYYPWEQFHDEFTITTVPDQGSYDLPVDWKYFISQTQWDRTNHWPLLGPKSAQEWAWLQGGLIASAPRTRYRIQANQFYIWPVPATDATPIEIAMEYVSTYWVTNAIQAAGYTLVTLDAQVIKYNPWLIMKYLKLKFYELKGFDTTNVQADFMRIFNSLTGKDVGGPILSLARRSGTQYVGPWSVPDGSWNVFGGP